MSELPLLSLMHHAHHLPWLQILPIYIKVYPFLCPAGNCHVSLGNNDIEGALTLPACYTQLDHRKFLNYMQNILQWCGLLCRVYLQIKRDVFCKDYQKHNLSFDMFIQYELYLKQIFKVSSAY